VCGRRSLSSSHPFQQIAKNLLNPSNSAYISFGFKIKKEVTEKDVQDRLVWGAIGTLMELDLESFFEKWTPRMPLLIEQAKRAREAEAEAQAAGDKGTENQPTKRAE
jgi:hypothetical protein